MGIIKTIKDLLGLTAIEKKLDEKQSQGLTREEFLAAIRELKTPSDTPAVTAQPIVPLSPQRSSGELEEVKQQLEAAQQQIRDLQQLLVTSKENALKDFLSAATEKINKPGTVGRPAIPGHKMPILFEADVYQKFKYLQALMPGLKLSRMVNTAMKKHLAEFYDEHPELQELIQEQIQKEE